MRIVKYIAEFTAIVLGLGLIFAWLGVYDTGQVPFGKRLIFWTSTMAVGAVSAQLLAAYFWSKRFDQWSAPVKIGILAMLVSIPVTAVLFIFNGAPHNINHVLIQYTYVLVISLIISTGMYVAATYQSASSARPESDRDPVLGFLGRLPVKYRTADLHAIASEDHYLRVYTSLGSELILMRLADAVRELAGADGLQVHRSWWIAKAAIRDEKRDNGRSRLVLPDGTEVPVSRSYRAKAKDAGLVA